MLILAVLVLTTLSGMAFWLHRNPQALAAHLAEEVRARSGMACTLDTADVVFFPVPSLGLTDIRIHNDSLDVSVGYVTVRPALLPLLRGNFEPGSITLLRPRVRWKEQAPAAELPEPPSPASAPSPAASSSASALPNWAALLQSLSTLDMPDMLHGTTIQLLHGSFVYAGPEQQISVDDVNVDMRLQALGGLNGEIILGQSLWKEGEEIQASLDGLNLRLSGKALRALQGEDFRVALETRVHMPELLRSVNLRLEATQKKALAGGAPQWDAQFHVNGHILWPETESTSDNTPKLAAIPLIVQGSLSRQEQQEVKIRLSRLDLGEDKLSLNASLDVVGKDAPRLSGDVDIVQLSLTQWFGFARRLPPGLQHTLHRLKGRLNFAMDSRGLSVPLVEVQAVDSAFSGTGAVPDWQNPVITLDVSSPALELGKAFPEAEGATPEAPLLKHAPLTPEPGSAQATAMPGPDIDYDIAVGVRDMQAWELSLGDVAFRCVPQQKSKGNAHNAKGVLMTIGAGRVYGGRADGRLVLYTPESNKVGYAIRADVKNVNLEPLVSREKSEATLGGRLTMDTEFTAQGKTLAEFFTTQDGVLRLRVDNGYVLDKSGKSGKSEKGDKAGKNKAEKWPFARLSLEARARGGPAATPAPGTRIPAELTYVGQWKASVETKELKGALQVDGPLTLSGKSVLPLQFQKLPGKVNLEIDQEWLKEQDIFSADAPLPATLHVDVSGCFSLHSGQNTLAVEEGYVLVPGLADTRIKGQAKLQLSQNSNQSPHFQGALEGSTANAHQLLRFFLPEIAKSLAPASLRKAEAEASIVYQDQELKLSNLAIKTEYTKVNGQVAGQWKKRPQWQFDLAADKLDVDTYLPPEKPDSTTKGAQTKPTAVPTPWNLAWMRQWDAKGTLRAETLRWHKFSLHKAVLPLSLQAGTLHCPARGTLYGAPTTLNVQAEATQGLQLRFSLDAQKMNMLALSQDRAMKTLLAGDGSVWAQVQGLARSSADLPSALDGTWRLQVNAAYTQARDAKGAPTGSRTALGTVQAAGIMKKGVLHSEQFSLSGAEMTAKGGGWVDLGKDTLDVNLVVKMYRIPEFPVRFYGSLDNPQRSINAGQAIVGTLGNLGSGMVDVIGNVLGGALKLFP